jgi:FKBP-type peptidyl-prolyl cis-trans isomerase
MKNFIHRELFIFAALFLFGSLPVCTAQDISSEKEKMSYSFGMVIAMDLLEIGIEFDYDAFARGFKDTMEREETQLSMEEALGAIEEAFNAVMAKQNEERLLIAEKNLAEGEAFLAANGERPEVLVTPSGLQYELLTEGEGEPPKPADKVLVHYQGATIGGFVFDSSYERGEPLEVPLDMVIPGWSEGIRMMREGGKAKLYIPSSLAYGENGVGDFIGPNEVLVFDVELCAILKSQSDEEDSQEE